MSIDSVCVCVPQGFYIVRQAYRQKNDRHFHRCGAPAWPREGGHSGIQLLAPAFPGCSARSAVPLSSISWAFCQNSSSSVPHPFRSSEQNTRGMRDGGLVVAGPLPLRPMVGKTNPRSHIPGCSAGTSTIPLSRIPLGPPRECGTEDSLYWAFGF